MVKNYHVDNVTIEEILGWIKEGRVGLPEMQRPIVWSTSKVRDLIDSLYNGYPIGYIVTWQNPTVGLKNDSSSNNKEALNWLAKAKLQVHKILKPSNDAIVLADKCNESQ